MSQINLNTKLSDLYPCLGSRTLSALGNKDLVNLKDLCRLEEFQVEGIRGLGSRGLPELNDFLEKYNLHYGMTELEIKEYQKAYEVDPPLTVTPEERRAIDQIWEQRRYELVRDQLVNQHFPWSKREVVEAVETADYIIKVMKGKI